MSANPTEQHPHLTRRSHLIALSILVSLIVAVGLLGAFFIGRRGASVGQMRNVLTFETNGMNLYEALGKALDDPLTAQAFANLYSVPVGDRDALAKRLRSVAWLPAYRPAPFVGHIARPVLGADPHINILGFRDERQSYVAKADRTVRIFITGGSTAWGSGASSQNKTISYLLEQVLNERTSPVTGNRYEVINAAFPAWSTTQEKLLIQQRLVDMHPDVILMFSGGNDVHWALQGRDIRWFYTYMDENYLSLLNELHRSSGHPEIIGEPFSSHPIECADLASITALNVMEAAAAAERAKARLIFALQPNVVSTDKHLSKHEQQFPELRHKPYWDSCYQALRDSLSGINSRNYQFIDLSRSFSDLDDSTELFVDSYHFADLGNLLVAQALANQIDWRSVSPSPAVVLNQTEALGIVSFEPSEWPANKPFKQFHDGSSWLRLVPSRVNQNLVVMFDQSLLPTVVADNAISASVSSSLYAAKGEHKIYLVDSMTGETSPPVVFNSR
jgi:lysophospholipase L1-like esterase